MSDATLTLTTADAPGAVAILQLAGGGAAEVLASLTGHAAWPVGRVRLCNFADIDEGLAVRLQTPGCDVVQLMPHGGPRVVRRLIDWLTAQPGVTYEAQPDARDLYAEAASGIEADMLAAIARAASPIAINLLAEQPRLWAQVPADAGAVTRKQILERSAVLDRLLVPPTVVVVGPANVGKSTLTNALMGRSVSIVADLPGTTRDWVGGQLELSPGIAVRWLDTPGLRTSDDAIEQRAIALARRMLDEAAVIVAMRDVEQGWPDTSQFPRDPDVWLMNKADQLPAEAAASPDSGGKRETPLHISAARGGGLDALQRVMIEQLGLSGLAPEPWAFSSDLKSWCAGQDDALVGYC